MALPGVAKKGEAEKAKEAARCVELRLTGMTYDQIAAQMGLSRSVVRERVAGVLAADPEHVDRLRALEAERLDALLRAVWGKALRGDLQAVDRALKIGAARRDLFGLDAPVRVEMTSELDLQILELAEQLGVNDEAASIPA